MEEKIKLIKRLYSAKVEDINDIQFMLCTNIFDKFRYSKVFIKGFNKSRRTFIIALLNCYGFEKEDLYLIYNQNKIIGCLTLREIDRRTMTLYDFTILPKYRGQNFSKKAFHKVYNICLDEGKKRLTLDVKKNNIIGYNLYMQEGFREY